MKPLVLLPLTLLAVSCYPADPYYQEPRPPYHPGDARAPYGPGGHAPGTETGTFEPLPGGNPPPPSPPVYPPGRPLPEPPVTPPAPQPAPRPSYPEAKRTANPNEVISPYAPYNVIDVEGFRSGSLAKDPSNGKIFRVP